MRNFIRSLRFSWAYRTRLILSIVCALFAAALWSLNFTAIYPVLKVLGSNRTLQEWVDERIRNIKIEREKIRLPDALCVKMQVLLADSPNEKLSEDLREKIPLLIKDRRKVTPDDEVQLAHAYLNFLERWPKSSIRDDEQRRVTGHIAEMESKLNDLSSRLYQTELIKAYFIRLLPNDGFLTLASLLGLVVLGVALKGFFEFWQESLVGSVTHKTLYDLRNRFYRKVIHQDIQQFNDAGTPELMTRFTNDMEVIGNGIKVLYGKVIAEPLRALGCLIVACWISWQLTFMFTILVPLALIILHKVSRMMKRATRRVLEGMSTIYKILQETFKGIWIVKSFANEPYERRRFKVATQAYYKQSMKVVHIDALASPIIELLGVTAVALALLAGAYLVLRDQTHLFGIRMSSYPIEAETLLQLYALLAAIADPVRKLSSVYTKLQSAAAAADRVFDYWDRQPQIQRNHAGQRIGPIRQMIEFNNVCFSYVRGQDILTNISFSVKAGETIALVGCNGCGKTTLVGMLPRFYDPQHGSILMDGVDIRQANLRSLRNQIAVVTQEPFLFDASIYENIAYGNRYATKEQIEEAARKARVTDFLHSLPEGFDTRCGEGGRHLSGGQRQRVALARAIVRNPSILILDEFTSQVDTQSEAAIHQALQEFIKGRTTFVITHRLHTLEMADRIIVLDAGRIVAIGTHLELLANCSVYQKLHEANWQFKAA